MTWGIIGALKEEIEAIKSAMQIEDEKDIMGQRYYSGSIEGVKLVLVCASIGKVNATCCAVTLAREYGVDVIVNTGIAGAMAKNLKMLDVVVSTTVKYHDHGDFFANYAPYSNEFEAEERLINSTLKACEKVALTNGFNYYKGKIVTGDLFVSTTEDKERIVNLHDPMCTEMEGAAIGQVAFMCGLPFVVIRSMSDSADDDAKESYDNLITDSANNASAIVLELIKLYK